MGIYHKNKKKNSISLSKVEETKDYQRNSREWTQLLSFFSFPFSFSASFLFSPVRQLSFFHSLNSPLLVTSTTNLASLFFRPFLLFFPTVPLSLFRSSPLACFSSAFFFFYFLLPFLQLFLTPSFPNLANPLPSLLHGFYSHVFLEVFFAKRG